MLCAYEALREEQVGDEQEDDTGVYENHCGHANTDVVWMGCPRHS
jgi:hypothetical protein